MSPKTAKYISTFFRIGLVKKFPGSVASLVTAIIWYLAILFGQISTILILFLNILIFLIAYYSIVEYQKTTNETDPQEIVIDEVSGMSISLIGGALYFSNSYFLISFFIFRILDFFKPSIIYRFEIDKKDSSILMDDVLSGLITLLVMLSLGSSGIV
tara:strand:+ start:436 stop:906 length:471 start_codon:yes stop_codon:yes gene_type:complete